MVHLAVRNWRCVRQVARARHVVFGCAVLELGWQIDWPRHVVFRWAVLELV
jgi:hypothetical protein